MIHIREKLIAVVASMFLALSTSTGINVNATNTSKIIDNDPIATGYGYTCTSNMTYYSATGSYNNDMRLSSTSSYAQAKYTYPQISVETPTYLRLGVYLNNMNFTDENSLYYYEFYPTCYAQVGYLNQNTAAGDWNYLYKFSVPEDFKGSAIEGVYSRNVGQNFDSDAVKVTVYY